jgi:hypothetical protein
MKILKKEPIPPLHVGPGISVNLVYTRRMGDTIIDQTTVLSHECTVEQDFDTAAIFELENGELGMECGLGGVFGKNASRP